MSKGETIAILFLLTWFIIIPIGTGIHFWYIGRPNSVYDIWKCKDYLWRARASTDLIEIANYFEKALNEIKDRHGNPKWYYPTPDTDFDLIKKTMKQTINNVIEIANKEEKGSYGYQRAIDNIEETIIELNEHLQIAEDWIAIWNTTNLTYLTIYLIITLVFIILMFYPR